MAKAKQPKSYRGLTPAQKAARTRAKTRKTRLQEAVKAHEAAKKQTAAWQKRSAAAKKGWETRRAINRGMKVIERIRNIIASWTPQENWSDATIVKKNADRHTLSALLEGAIQRDGEREVARRLDKNADQNLSYVDVILYNPSDDDKVDTAISNISDVINGKPLDAEESAQLNEEMEDLMNFYESTYIARV